VKGERRTVAGLEARAEQELDRGDEEGEGLAGAGLGGAEHVAALQKHGNAARLHLGHLREAHVVDGLAGVLAEVKRVKVEVDVVAVGVKVGLAKDVGVARRVDDLSGLRGLHSRRGGLLIVVLARLRRGLLLVVRVRRRGLGLLRRGGETRRRGLVLIGLSVRRGSGSGHGSGALFLALGLRHALLRRSGGRNLRGLLSAGRRSGLGGAHFQLLVRHRTSLKHINV
jgi:hypothetical protein